MSRAGEHSSGLLRRVRKGQVWGALLSLSLALSVATELQESRSAPETIERFQLPDRALDPSLAYGFAAPIEGPSVGLFTLSLLLSFGVLFLALSLLNAWLDRRLDSGTVAGEKSGLMLLSEVSLGLFGLHLIAGEAVPVSMRGGVHLLAGLLLGSMVAKRLIADRLPRSRSWGGLWGVLNDHQLMLAGLFFPVVSMALIEGFTRGVIRPLGFLSNLRDFGIYLVVLVVLILTYALVLRRKVASGESLALTLFDLDTAIIVGGAPLMLIPLGFQIANELQYTLGVQNSRWPAALVVGVLFGASLLLYGMQRRGSLRLTGSGLLGGFYFPVAVATLASLKTYRHTLKLGELDYFHTGEQVLPTQQWLDFGSLPLLDLIPAHGFSDVGIQSLYSLINGSQGLDMLVWLPWIPVVVGFVVIYSFLAVVSSPLLALVVTISLPVKLAVVGPYAIALLPATLLVIALRRPDFPHFLVLWAAATLLIFWRPQLGWPVLIATLLVVGAASLLENRQVLSPALSALGLLAFAVPVLLVIADIFGTADTLDTLRALTGATGSAAGRGMGGLATPPGSVGLATFMEGLLPLVAIVALLFYGVRKLMGGPAFRASSYAVLFLAVFSLLSPARLEPQVAGLCFDPSMLLLMLALLPFLVFHTAYRNWMSGRTAWLIVTLVFCALLGRISLYHLTGEASVHRQRSWKVDESRVDFDQSPHRDLVEVLQRELQPGETFLDFTDSPLLYSLAGFKMPSQEIPDFRSTSEPRQRAQIEALEMYREKFGLPLVVLQAPPAVAQAERELSVASTSYRIAEYLYQEYLPFAVASGWEIWRERGVRRETLPPPAQVTSPSAVSQHFWLGSLPYRWAKGDPYEAGRKTDLLEALLEAPAVLRPGGALTLKARPRGLSGQSNYLQIRALALPASGTSTGAPTEARLTLTYGQEPRSSFELTLAPQTDQMGGTVQQVEIPLADNPKLHQMTQSEDPSGRLILSAENGDPWVRRFIDPSTTGSREPGEEWSLRLDYRSSLGGTAQLYYASVERHFKEANSAKAPMVATREQDDIRQLVVPVVGIAVGRKLVDLRLDPPDDAEFEIVGVTLIRRRREVDEYLVRLSSQWRWFSEDIQSLILQSNTPVFVDSVNLRTGD